MSESFLIRLDGGPNPGDYLISAEWPLPRELHDKGGMYTKIRESALPSMRGAGILRGAEYEWAPDEPAED